MNEKFDAITERYGQMLKTLTNAIHSFKMGAQVAPDSAAGLVKVLSDDEREAIKKHTGRNVKYMWQCFKDEKGNLHEYGEGEFEKFCKAMPPAGLGREPEEVRELSKFGGFHGAFVSSSAEGKEWAKHGEIGNGRSRPTTGRSKYGNNPEYILHRLEAKGRGDLAELYRRGEISITDAAREANIRKKYFQVQHGNPESAARQIRKYFDDEGVNEIIRLLSE